jgi:TatD DNase family protein
MLVDSHCHLTLAPPDVEKVLAEALRHGVGYLLCVSVDVESFPQILAIAQTHKQVFASVGVHPNTELQLEPTAEQLAKLAEAPEVVAIGETGLDYYRSSGDLEWQRRRFRTHIAAAKACKKPLIIHTREAAEDTLRILKEEHADEVGGVMHCFVDDWETAQKALDLNFYISFSGIVTFPKATQVQDVARRVPFERLLVETDSPYLAPVPYRGKENQPAYVRYVAEHIAKLRDISFEELADQTTRNFSALFKKAAIHNFA